MALLKWLKNRRKRLNKGDYILLALSKVALGLGMAQQVPLALALLLVLKPLGKIML